MQFKQYPSYKNSGVEWLGDVPEHWEVKPNKYVFKIQKRIAGTLGFNVLSITQKGLKVKDIESNTGQMAQDYSKYQIVNVGDFAMNHMDLLTGWIDIAKVKGVTSPDYRVFEVRNKKVNKEYFLHLFQLGYRNKILFAFGQGAAQMGRWRLQSETFNTLKMPFPSIDEQQKIVAFLNTETIRIDNLITKQEKLIELLEEQRKSIISHAVTKGLNPNAPMKDSGVEWLGEVPEHWDVTFIKYITKKISSGKTPLGGAEVYTDEGVIFLRSQNIYNDGLHLDDVSFIPHEIHASMKSSTVKKNDVLLNITGGSIGRTCLVDREIGEANVNQHVCIIRASKDKYAKWISVFMKSNSAQSQIFYSQTGAGREGLNFSQIGNMRLPFPPFVEQQEILDFLNQENLKFDKLISKQNKLIEKLKEYRSSIISHAVTGKIDVREFVA